MIVTVVFQSSPSPAAAVSSSSCPSVNGERTTCCPSRLTGEMATVIDSGEPREDYQNLRRGTTVKRGSDAKRRLRLHRRQQFSEFIVTGAGAARHTGLQNSFANLGRFVKYC